MGKISKFLLVFLFTNILSAPAQDGAFPSISVDEDRFVDEFGRQVILHGINVGGLDKNGDNWTQPKDRFEWLRQWGFNCIRMQTHWSEIEPECGKYDEAYLKSLDRRIEEAAKQGLYVLVDMHQDLWGPKARGDGAPLWATLDNGQPHLTPGPLWSDAYMTSPMVQISFDSFWANQPGPDGIGIQDRFALAWQIVAKRYTQQPAVIGYEILNEPSPGSLMLEAGKMTAEKMLAELSKRDLVKEGQDPMSAWFNPEIRNKILVALNDPELYRQFASAADSIHQKFEREQLGAMYQRVAMAIRQAEAKKILFYEPGTSSIIGGKSDIQPIVDAQGKRDPFQALAPHAYDLVTDLPNSPTPTLDRMRLIMERHRELTQRLNIPVLLGEWGAYPGDRRAEAEFVASELEAWLVGDTYWIFGLDIEKAPHFPLLERPYPAAVAGKLLKYQFNPDTRIFTCEWEENPSVRKSSRFFIPERWYPQGYEIQTTHDQQVSFESLTEGKRSGFAIVAPSGRQEKHALTIRPVQNR